MRKLQDMLQLATYKDLVIIFDALIEKEKEGKLSKETKRVIKIYNDYYKQKCEQ